MSSVLHTFTNTGFNPLFTILFYPTSYKREHEESTVKLHILAFSLLLLFPSFAEKAEAKKASLPICKCITVGQGEEKQTTACSERSTCKSDCDCKAGRG